MSHSRNAKNNTSRQGSAQGGTRALAKSFGKRSGCLKHSKVRTSAWSTKCKKGSTASKPAASNRETPNTGEILTRASTGSGAKLNDYVVVTAAIASCCKASNS